MISIINLFWDIYECTNHSVKKKEIHSHMKIFCEMTFFCKNAAFTKFLSIRYEIKIQCFPHCANLVLSASVYHFDMNLDKLGLCDLLKRLFKSVLIVLPSTKTFHFENTYLFLRPLFILKLELLSTTEVKL